MAKKEPIRQCAGCLEQKTKKELIRIIRTPEGVIEIDYTGRKNGRGTYLCKNEECLKHAFKTEALNRLLKINIPPEIYEDLERQLIEK